MDKINIGVVTTSDRASQGIYEDESGKAIMETMKEYLKNEIEFYYRCVPDEKHIIEEALLDLSRDKKCDLVVTTGGTGPAPRDVTVDATLTVCDKILPGFGEQMRAVSLQYVPTAILSRQTAGICCSTLIINLPGKPKSIRECLDAVFPAVPYCLDLIGAGYMEVNEEVIKAFRPKGK
ncbi:molybdopterin adenylyltransferase [Nitratifractor salsuginis]|uniref:Molybdopterin adenylyltransferase n=1 Tax=Nitratifractor salsuginis (strain DSM 16511 / JCM 12458 / E9I37-1) TaxID=749222 RepID=E6WYU7_NITSE|nr:molybdopterin adenylyltransferase [Nitratifractor salsuginis]ADV46533.1 molybdopterin adenylyltransferase [Nitratifractor salsuginis DSM 16511]